MLAIEVDFLLGRYSAADFRDRDRPEWPPHPSRLFSAMVAASFESGLGTSARVALLWLEQLPPPEIYADEADEQASASAYVPVNDPTADFLPDRAERRERSFPSVVPRQPTVCFVWPQAEPDETQLGTLREITAAMGYLGSSRCPVRVRLGGPTGLPRWFPKGQESPVLRVPSRGRLEGLEARHSSGLRPTIGVFKNYAPSESRMDAESAFGEMILFRLGGELVRDERSVQGVYRERPLRMEIVTTLKLTDALRNAVMKVADQGEGVPDILSGHGEHPHAAYVALPYVDERPDWKRRADGRILGLAIILPRKIVHATRRDVFRAVARLGQVDVERGPMASPSEGNVQLEQSHFLDVVGVGKLALRHVTPGEWLPYNLRPETWSGPARIWTSATPVLLDRFPKEKGPSAEEIIALSCGNVVKIGPNAERPLRPDEATIEISRFSPLYGADPSWRYVKERRDGSPLRHRTHVTVAFDHEVRGPILLGAGRYFGLGLMRPLRAWATRGEVQQ